MHRRHHYHHHRGFHIAPVADWFTDPDVRKARVKAKFRFRTARVQAKAEGGKWNPASVAARQQALSDIGTAGIGAVAGGVAGVFGGPAAALGAIKGAKAGGTDTDDAAPDVASESGGSGISKKTWLIIGAVAFGGILLMKMK